MKNVVLSPYFTTNTKIVTNFCRKCYYQENEVLISAVNVIFLQKYDTKYYQEFIHNFPTSPNVKFDEEREEPNCKRIFYSKLRHRMTTKRRIVNKYYRILRNLNTINIKYSGFRSKYKQFRKTKIIKDEVELNFEKTFKQEPTYHRTEQKCKKIQGLLENEEYLKVNQTKSEDKTDFEVKNKWIPPISPHNLLEEKYYNDPWALLVVTIFLNKTSSSLALPYMEEFFEDFKGPFDVLKVKEEQLEPYFTKIGLIRTRATQVWRMSFDFVHKEWKNVGELYGVGKYGEDAYRIFHLGDFSVEPTDRYLKIYKAWYEMKKKQEKTGVFETNSQVYLEDYYVEPEFEDRSGLAPQ